MLGHVALPAGIDEVVDRLDPAGADEVEPDVEPARGFRDGDHVVVEHAVRLALAAVGRGHARNPEKHPQQHPEQVRPAHVRVDHVDAAASGAAYAYYFDEPNHRFIVEWDSVQFYSWSHRRVTFEVILYDPVFYETLTGDAPFQFQYKRVDFDMACTVGMENAAETDGIQYLYNTVLDSNAAGVVAGRSIYFTTGDVVFSEPAARSVPGEFYLAPCWPNPFNPTTTFEWGMPQVADVRLEIFDILGRRAAVIADGNYAAGVHRATFDGRALATGIYFARLQANGRIIQNRKMLLVK